MALNEHSCKYYHSFSPCSINNNAVTCWQWHLSVRQSKCQKLEAT